MSTFGCGARRGAGFNAISSEQTAGLPHLPGPLLCARPGPSPEPRVTEPQCPGPSSQRVIPSPGSLSIAEGRQLPGVAEEGQLEAATALAG